MPHILRLHISMIHMLTEDHTILEQPSYPIALRMPSLRCTDGDPPPPLWAETDYGVPHPLGTYPPRYLAP